ncbi:MAG: hypothetical protein AAGJ68_11440, partial [Pseudomonadota bacterium]
SDVSLNWADASSVTDGVSFSTDGVDFSYTPTVDADGADAAITHVRFALTGAMRQRVDGISDPSFRISFQAIVR